MNFKSLSLSLFLGLSVMPAAQAAQCPKSRPPVVVSTIIQSTAQEVWDVMLDFKNYADWNRWVVRIDGDPIRGGWVRAYNAQGAALDLRITSIQAHQSICWTDVTWFTHFGVGGWRCRNIEVLPDGQGVKVTNHFEYTGVFALALDLASRKYLEYGMKLENESLRDFVEGRRRESTAP